MKSCSKLRDFEFSFRMKVNRIDDCARGGVCNMHELHFKIGRRVGKVILYKPLGELSLLVQYTIFWAGTESYFPKIESL